MARFVAGCIAACIAFAGPGYAQPGDKKPVASVAKQAATKKAATPVKAAKKSPAAGPAKTSPDKSAAAAKKLAAQKLAAKKLAAKKLAAKKLAAKKKKLRVSEAQARKLVRAAKLRPHNMSGVASIYWRGRRTATGEKLRTNTLTAAHMSLPLGTRVRVTNKRNGKTVVVRINDRGPFVRKRVLDLTPAAARALGFTPKSGVAPVSLAVIRKNAKSKPSTKRTASIRQ